MADGGESDGGVRTWRVTGWRRWVYVVLLVLFLVQAASRLVSLLSEPPPHTGDGILLGVWLVGALGYGVVVLQCWRTRVTLRADGVEVRELRRRFIRYADVERAYRDRFSAHVVSLDLVDGTRTSLPAPVGGPKDPAPEIDEAVALVQARVAAARTPGGGGAPG
ncbi:hypothetical protein SAMN04488544_1755 [Microlunatus sagamiharensis]|uniref:PH domain-containing protein n=1 Tax=Microlunatus sagamiharensis TaxID=546874 RepID=A0A1H2MBH3_9ACTN|nr:hypothetical protein [Microlunatus sagamiharensis]SDU90563.1 hypothetical protein SAMN04488544_1755 [Microlunatus sagamiharensis]